MKKQRKHKWKYRINLRKKILVLVILGVSLFVGLGYAILESNLEIFGTLEVSKYDRTLYTALKKEVGKGYALKYTGAHQDSMDPSKSTEDIYHFYGSTAAKGTEILNKNNVLFADKCWQMIRTTDTGGVKLLYNGEPETSVVNGETQYNCGDTRTLYHIGGILKELNLSGTYKYAKNYTATTSGTKTTFTLVDDPNDPNDCKTITVNESNAQSTIEDIIENYPYTCKNASGTCQATAFYNTEIFYKVDGYSSSTNANVYLSTYRDRIGNTEFNSMVNSPAYVGYMYGDVYPINYMGFVGTENFGKTYETLGKMSLLSTSYYYADSFTYDENTNTYTLTNPVGVTNATNYKNLVYKYMMDGVTSGDSVMYVIGVDGPPFFVGDVANFVKLTGGVVDTSIKFSDNVIDNGDGTFTLDNPIDTVSLKDWTTGSYTNYSHKYTCGSSDVTCSSAKFVTEVYKNAIYWVDTSQTITLAKARDGLSLIDYTTIKVSDYFQSPSTAYEDYLYTCGNNDTTCTEANLRYIKNKISDGYKYYKNFSFGSDVVYENNKYKLQNVVGLEDLDDADVLSSHHYTCADPGETECAPAIYVFYFDGEYGYGIQLNDPNIIDIGTMLNNMFTKNTTSSNIKNKIDAWYEKELKDTIYEAKLDDTIYCNDRSIRTTGTYTLARSGWNPNGGKLNQTLGFKEATLSKDLNCTNLTDRFSVANNAAKLTYKIGLLTAPETSLLNQNSARAAPYSYWIASPVEHNMYNQAELRSVETDGNIGKTSSNSSHIGTRPAISLIAGTEYTKGDGSMTNPYIVRMD